MNYAQAAALEATLLNARLAADSVAAHVKLAHDIAVRAGLETKDPTTGERRGIATGLELLVLKTENIVNLVNLFGTMFDEHLAGEGDAIAAARVAARATSAPDEK